MARFDLIRVGLIGYGIGKVYAAALRDVARYYADLPPVELVMVATATEASGKRAVEQSGFERYTTDYRELLASEDINTVIIATPHYLHREMLLAALATDKALYTDKPLANNLAEAQEIVADAQKRGRDAQISFTLRYYPAIRNARKLLRDGYLGKIYSFRLAYYRASYRNPEKPLRWKAQMAKSGGGVLSDLVPHLIDLLTWLIDMPEQVAAQTRTFITERPIVQGSHEKVRVETDDHVIIQAALPGGAIGTIESGRLIAGAISNLAVEVYGSGGSLRWNIMDPHYLYVADARKPDSEQGWQQIETLATLQNDGHALTPETGISTEGMSIDLDAFADFLRKTREGASYNPGLEQGLRVQEVIEMAAEANRTGTWIVHPMKGETHGSIK